VEAVLLAGDAAPGQVAKLTGLLRARDVPTRIIGDRAALGAAVGAGPLTAVGVTRQGFAQRLLTELDADAEVRDGPSHAPEDDQTYAG
jgi:ribosomal protein L7Ae-like RNA K-turn-binding protein